MTKHYNLAWLTERFEDGDTLKFLYFWGHANKYNEAVGEFCFSQRFESPFTIQGITYKTAEHWMMAQKALLFKDIKGFDRIIHCDKPGEAKELGRQVAGYDDGIWNEKKFDIVKFGNIHKFNQHPEIAEYLLRTGSKVLVEASQVDIVWGIGLSQDRAEIDDIYAWRGQNLLGFVLMEVRDFFNDFGHFKIIENGMEPPWRKFPGINSLDMFWRMGQGEDYLISFLKFYSALSDSEKTIFKLSHPLPFDWSEFYD